MIILTEFGAEKISNESEWREKNNTIYNTTNKNRTVFSFGSGKRPKETQSTGNLKERIGRNI